MAPAGQVGVPHGLLGRCAGSLLRLEGLAGGKWSHVLRGLSSSAGLSPGAAAHPPPALTRRFGRPRVWGPRPTALIFSAAVLREGA